MRDHDRSSITVNHNRSENDRTDPTLTPHQSHGISSIWYLNQWLASILTPLTPLTPNQHRRAHGRRYGATRQRQHERDASRGNIGNLGSVGSAAPDQHRLRQLSLVQSSNGLGSFPVRPIGGFPDHGMSRCEPFSLFRGQSNCRPIEIARVMRVCAPAQRTQRQEGPKANGVCLTDIK